MCCERALKARDRSSVRLWCCASVCARLRVGLCVVGLILRSKMDAVLYTKNGHQNNFNLMTHTIEVCAVSGRSLIGAVHVVFDTEAHTLGAKPA